MNYKLDQQAYENRIKSHIQAALSDRLDQAGLSEPRLLKILNEGLEAMAVKTASHEGEITDSRVFPNHAIRHRFLETTLKLRGMFPAEKKDLWHDFHNYSEGEKKATVERVNGLIRQKVEQEIQHRVAEELRKREVNS